jgi:hypothetical protein
MQSLLYVLFQYYIIKLSNLKDEGSFSQNIAQIGISSLVSKNGIFSSIFGILTIGSCTRLLGEHVQKNSKKLTVRIVRL